MHIVNAVVAASVTLGTVGASYVALDPDRLEGQAQVVADQATCRTVESAIVAFFAETGSEPTSTADLASFVRGDIAAYRIVDGQAAGPGC